MSSEMDEMTVRDAIYAVAEGQLGAIAILKAVASQTGGPVPSPEDADEEGRDALDQSAVEDLDANFSQMLAAPALNICHIILLLANQEITGDKIEVLYRDGCKNNMIVFGICTQVAAKQFLAEEENQGFVEMVKNAADGEFDLTTRVIATPRAVADMNEIEEIVAEEEGGEPAPVGIHTIDELIEQHCQEELLDSGEDGDEEE